MLIFVFVGDASEVRPIVVKSARSKGIENATGRHRTDIEKKKKERKRELNWKKIVDGDVICGLKTKKV